MARALGCVCLVSMIAGCQAQSPYAPFGPPTVPAPAANQLPYYPPGTASTTAAPAATATRPSISVSGPSAAAPRTAVPVDAADREPIRIVENAVPTRTADSGRPKSPAPAPAQPRQQPPAQHGAPASSVPAVSAPLPDKATGQRARIDSAVKPAAHQATPQAFREAAPAGGQWRAR